MTGSDRMRRVDEAMRKVLSQAVAELKDPRIGFVTVTGVRTTNDLDHATVYVSVLGSEKKRDATMRALEGATGVLQARVGRELHLRRTPHLKFAYDAAVERGVRMSALIDDVAPQGESDSADDGAG